MSANRMMAVDRRQLSENHSIGMHSFNQEIFEILERAGEWDQKNLASWLENHYIRKDVVLNGGIANCALWCIARQNPVITC